MAVTSAAGLLTLLDDDSDDLKRYALVNLNKVVHEFWFQIATSIAVVEALYEDDAFSNRELAALIASKVCLATMLCTGLHTCLCAPYSRSFAAPAGVLPPGRAGCGPHLRTRRRQLIRRERAVGVCADTRGCVPVGLPWLASVPRHAWSSHSSVS